MLIAFNFFMQKIKKKNCIKLWAINSEICSILSFWVFLGFLHLILYMIYQGKCFSCYVLLTDQVSLSDCFYFLRYWGICVLQLFVSQVVTSNFEINLIFLIKVHRKSMACCPTVWTYCSAEITRNEFCFCLMNKVSAKHSVIWLVQPDVFREKYWTFLLVC